MKPISPFLISIFLSSFASAQTPEPRQDTPIPRDNSSYIALEIPISPYRKTVDIARINDKTINLGTVIEPWEDMVFYGLLPPINFGYYSKSFVFRTGGGIMENFDSDRLRKNKYFEINSKLGIWKTPFFAEFDGFADHERMISAITGLEFNSDFLRFSRSGTISLGIRAGDFHGNYLAFKFGKGYIETEGNQIFFAPSLPGFDLSLPIYEEQFNTDSISINGRFKFTELTYLEGELENKSYYRAINSPDPFRYGMDNIEDLIVKISIETIPWKKYETFRLVVRGTKNFRKNDGLLFRNDQPSLQFYVRFLFKQ